MTPLELEQCILLAYSDVTGEKHWQATRALAEYQAEAATLLPLLQTTTHETVLFFCLTSCFKLQNSTFTEKTQLWHLVLHISSEAPHVRTKAAVVLAYLLQYAFQPCDWNTTFQELQQEAPPDLYFKTLIALAEDCDFDSCGIKDVMRGYHNTTTTIQEQPTIVAQLMDTLLRHVSQHDKDETILTLAFFVLRDFASWVDVTLLIQDQVMMLVFSSLSSSSAGVAAVQFLRELVSRGMNDERKLELLQQVDVLHKLHVHVNLKTVDANPIEVVIEVAKLIDVTGQELISIRMDTASLDSEYTAKLQKLWLQVMELFFRCLAFDDIDVSGAVLPLASRIVITLQNDDMPALQLLNIVHAQMKYPDDYQFDYQNDDEAEEEVYRAELRKLYQKLVRACPDFCLQFLCQVLANLSVPLSTCPTRDIEAALRLVHHYCEGIRPPPGLKTVMKQPTFCAVLTALHQSDVVDHPHREVLLLYYDLSVRYYPIFIKEPQLLPKLLGGLSGERGLLHAHPRVKSRSCYLLLRLVKSVIKVMRPYVETAVTGIQGLLTNPNGYQQQLRPDDALYLFETMGLLLGKTGLAPADQQTSLAQVVSPHIRSMEQMLHSDFLQRDPESCGERLAASVAAIAYLSKGFKDPPVEVQLVLAETISITLSVLETLPENDDVRSKTFVLLQRMILCLHTKILSTMPRFFRLLIEHCTTEDIQDLAQLLNQLSIKFGADAIPAIDPALLPFLRKCHELIPSVGEVVASASSHVPPHLLTEQLSVKKLTFTVMQHVVTYRLSPVLLSPTNANSLELVLRTMSEAAIHVEDPVVKKACTTFFRELVDQWIDDGSSNEAIGSVRAGFLLFVLQVYIPGMLQCMLSPAFDHEDAMQARNVSEFANTLFLLKSRIPGNEFEQNVICGALASLGCPPEALTAFGQVTTQQEMELCLRETLKVLKQA